LGLDGFRDSDTVEIDVPEGFGSLSFFSRLCHSGLTNWKQIKSGELTIGDCYEMTLMLDWQDMIAMKAKLESKRGDNG